MADTIIYSKEAFIAAQVKLLSRPLELSPEIEEESAIPIRAIDQAMEEANREFSAHNKSVYDALAVRLIAEQIDNLYWVSAAPDVTADIDRWHDEGIIKKDEDLTDEGVIARLSTSPYNSEKFAELLDRLKILAQRRVQLRDKLQLYRRMQKQIEPLSDPQKTVQPNIVTRDAALADVLSKSKLMGIRVAGRVAGAKRAFSVADNDGTFDSTSQQEKLKRALREI